MQIKDTNQIIIGDGIRADIAEKIGCNIEDEKVYEVVKIVENLCLVYYREGYKEAGQENSQAVHEATSKLQ